MEFTSANPSVVRSITQRVLLNAWLRAARRHQPLPLLADFEPGDIASELPDMMGYDVEGDDEPFDAKMTRLATMLTKQFAEGRELERKIVGGFRELGLKV